MARLTFTQADIKRAIKAARDAGIDTDEIRIEPDGAIRIMVHRDGASTSRDVRDEIARHFNGKN